MSERYSFEGKSDVGIQKIVNEDYIDTLHLDDDTLLLLIADGSGSDPEGFQPAIIASTEIKTTVKRIFDKRPALALNSSDLVLYEAYMNANRVLSVFAVCDPERYLRIGCSVTCCLLYQREKRTYASIASVGNTRLYLIRLSKHSPSIHLLTVDHTKAADMVTAGLLNEEDYYSHLDRLVITSALGISPEPKIQILENILIKKDDIVLMTTDGIHYAIRSEAMCDIVLQSGSCSDAVCSLIEAAKLEKYPDNMSAIVAYIP